MIKRSNNLLHSNFPKKYFVCTQRQHSKTSVEQTFAIGQVADDDEIDEEKQSVHF